MILTDVELEWRSMLKTGYRWQVTPVLGMLLDMGRQRRLPQGRKLRPRKVYLTYAMHYKEEAALLEKAVINNAM